MFTQLNEHGTYHSDELQRAASAEAMRVMRFLPDEIKRFARTETLEQTIDNETEDAISTYRSKPHLKLVRDDLGSPVQVEVHWIPEPDSPWLLPTESVESLYNALSEPSPGCHLHLQPHLETSRPRIRIVGVSTRLYANQLTEADPLSKDVLAHAIKRCCETAIRLGRLFARNYWEDHMRETPKSQ